MTSLGRRPQLLYNVILIFTKHLAQHPPLAQCVYLADNTHNAQTLRSLDSLEPDDAHHTCQPKHNAEQTRIVARMRADLKMAVLGKVALH